MNRFENAGPKPEAAPVDVLAVLTDEYARMVAGNASAARRNANREIRAAVAELIEAARAANAEFIEAIKYDHEDDEVGVRVCCNVVSYQNHAPGCEAVRLAAALARIGGGGK